MLFIPTILSFIGEHIAPPEPMAGCTFVFREKGDLSRMSADLERTRDRVVRFISIYARSLPTKGDVLSLWLEEEGERDYQNYRVMEVVQKISVYGRTRKGSSYENGFSSYRIYIEKI